MGQRLDNRNLITEWLKIRRDSNAKVAYVGNKTQLQSLDVNKTDYLLGKYTNATWLRSVSG